MNLRPYQERAISDLRASYAAGRRAPCLVLPTGAGKTVVAAEIIRSAVTKGRKVLFLAHRVELLDQTLDKLARAGVTACRVVDGTRNLGDPLAPVTVASVQTLTTARWMSRLPPADLVVQDEAHHANAATFKRLLVAYPQAKLLGLTATPERADGKPLGDLFDALVVGATVRELTELGHLVPCRVWAPRARHDGGEIAMTPVQAYQQYAAGARAVVFCSTLEHAHAVSMDMVVAGIASEVVDGSMSSVARGQALTSFRDGSTRVLCNVHVLTEGWDCPAASVCILLRKPEHVGTYLQMVGRILRPAPGKTHATVVDLCGSAMEHGPPDIEREYSLEGKAISSATERDAIRQCQYCGGVFRATRMCPQCGTEQPARPVVALSSTGHGVVEVTKAAPRPMSKPVTITAKFDGKCGVCGIEIRAGSLINWRKGTRPSHAGCG